MDDIVFVVAGRWEGDDVTGWVFKVTKEWLGRCVYVDLLTTYIQLKWNIEREFQIDREFWITKITYWPPVSMAMLPAAQIPPVLISSDAAVTTFRHLKSLASNLNLFVTFERQIVNPRNPILLDQEPLDEASVNSPLLFTNIMRLHDSTPSWSGGESNEVGHGWVDTYLGNTLETQVTREMPDLNCHAQDEGMSGEDYVMIDALGRQQDEEQKTNRNKRQVRRQLFLGSSSASGKEQSTGKEKLEDDFLQQIDKAEKMHMGAAESNGKLDKGKAVVVDLSQTSNSDDDEIELSDESDGDSYPYDTWHDYVLNDCVDFTIGDGMEVGQPSTQRVLSSIVENAAGEAAGDEASEEADGEADGEQDAQDQDMSVEEAADLLKAIRLSRDSMRNETDELILTATHDPPPCFDTGYVATQDMGHGVFDENNDAIFIGRQFRNRKAMQDALANYAIKRLFAFRQTRSDPTRLIVKCLDRNCKWRVFGKTVGGVSETIEVKTAILTHTCDITTRSQYGRRATARVIAEVLKSKYTNGKKGPRAIEIPDIIREELNVNITYMKAWHAREKALISGRGCEEGSYSLLTVYLHLLQEANPGTVYTVESKVDKQGNERFKYMFLAIGACLEGAKFCRKVVVIDGTTIKAKFRGCMMTASVQDGNYQILPIGFGVVDGENEEAWTWFFTELSAIVPDSADLVIVSDRHTAIYSALRTVYPTAIHGACSVHLYRNVKARFKVKGLAYLVSQASRAFTVGEFKELFAEIERRNPQCANYLRNIGIAHWSQAHFEGMRYNIMSSNVSECLNAALAKALEFPIVAMVETIRLMLMRWFHARRSKANNQLSNITEEVEKILVKHLKEASGFSVQAATSWIYQVNRSDGTSYTVDLAAKTCTCKVFDKLLIPCGHAIAAAKFKDIPIPSLVSSFYTVDTWKQVYAGVVMPVPNAADEEIPCDLEDDFLEPPNVLRAPGRPRKRRIPSVGEVNVPKKGKRGPNRCSKCCKPGHNRKTCDMAIP